MKAMVSTVVAGAALLAAGSAGAQGNQCTARAEFELQQHGLSMSEMKDVHWQEERFAAGQHNEDGTISGYSFYARPASCSEGQIVIEMWPDCGVQDIYTHGGCEIKGVFSTWF